MMWECTVCGRKFRNKNQWHSCYTSDNGAHLDNKPHHIVEIVDKIIYSLSEKHEFDVHPVKSAIILRTKSNFLSIRPMKARVELEFQLPREHVHPPVYRTARISRNRVLHFAAVKKPKELDESLLGLIEESYRLIAGG